MIVIDEFGERAPPTVRRETALLLVIAAPQVYLLDLHSCSERPSSAQGEAAKEKPLLKVRLLAAGLALATMALLLLLSSRSAVSDGSIALAILAAISLAAVAPFPARSRTARSVVYYGCLLYLALSLVSCAVSLIQGQWAAALLLGFLSAGGLALAIWAGRRRKLRVVSMWDLYFKE